MALPAGIPTLQLGRTGGWSRPDNVWISLALYDNLTLCDTDPAHRGLSDHLPIVTTLDIPIDTLPPEPTRNARLTVWDDFRAHLQRELAKLSQPSDIESQEELDEVINGITAAAQSAIEAKVPLSKAREYVKAWWTSELTAMTKSLNKLNHEAHKWRGLRDHPIHAQ
ncbi:hypothetical protein PENSPDRAFT_595458, partial [Peniophora sp. CONT]